MEKSEIPSLLDLAPEKGMRERIKKWREKIDFSDPEWSARIAVSFLDEPKRIAHSVMVGYASREVAQEITKRNKDIKLDVDTLFHAGVLHDIGQYGRILGKTPWHEMKGGVIAKTLSLPDKIAKMITHHATPIEGLEYEGREIPGWVRFPETLEERILSLVDFLVLQGGEIVSLDKRLKDIYERHKGKPAAAITKSSEKRFEKMFREIDKLVGNRLLEILKGVEEARLEEIKAKIPQKV